MKEYSDLFKGLGCFRNEYKIQIKENANPVAHAPRRVPVAIKSKLKVKLDEMVDNKIIEKSNELSEWVHHLVTAEKKDANKSLRVCIDPVDLNKNILDEQSYIPTFDDVTSKLSGMEFFSVLDLKDGFYHVRLSPESRKLCTFATPFGNYRYIRMPFGIKTGPKVFQKLNFENFGDISNVIIYFDDILIFGRTKQEHDLALITVLKRARERNIKFNINKVQIGLKQVRYLGHIFELNSVKPDPERLKAIESLSRPKHKRDLQTFMGVINYLRSFIPNMSEKTAPLRELLKKNTIFFWTELHTKVFEEIKLDILRSNILVPFNEHKQVVVQCDASQSGLGCCLLQDGKPISFASRSLTKNEQNYSQIEKEFLSILFACEKFHFYTYGRAITVVNDHKPLLGVIKKEICRIPSAKLQRIRIKLLNYDINLEHAPGKTIQLADYLSRYMIQVGEEAEDKTLTESVLSINVSDERKKQFQEQTEKDENLKLIKDFCKNGWPKEKSKCPVQLKYFYKLRNDIILDDDLLFYNERIIVPAVMRKAILNKLHEPHFGMTKTKQRARASVFWPNINNEIEQIVMQCRECQLNSPNKQKEPLIQHEIPNEPFKKVACDILEYGSKSYLVVIDYYSKWIELCKLKNKTAKQVNFELLRIFSTFGYPHVIIADNMPMGSYESSQFAASNDIKIITSSPNYAQSNGMAERAVQICKNILKKSDNEENVLKSLLAYRTTQIKDINFTPAQLLQNRNLRNELPMHENKFKPKVCTGVEQQIANKQQNVKTYYDRNAKNGHVFEKDDCVIFQNNNKWQMGKIIEKHNTPRSYVVNSDGRSYRRNARHIRMYHSGPHNETSNQNRNTPHSDLHPKRTRSGQNY